MNPIRSLDYEEIKARRPKKTPGLSRREEMKTMDEEQLRVFKERQKRLPELWRRLGIVGIVRRYDGKTGLPLDGEE